MEGELEAVALLERQLRMVGQMTFHRPQPTLFRNDHGDRLALDHGVRDVGQIMFGRVGELGPALAEPGLRSERLHR